MSSLAGRRMLLAAVAAASLPAFVGCYFTSSFEGLSSGEGAGLERDGGTADGPAIADALAPGDTSGAEGETCDGAAFCDGFERPDLLGDWDGSDSASGAGLRIIQDRARTGGSALRVSIPTQRSAAAELTKTFPLAARVELSYWFFLATRPKQSNMAKVAFLYEGRKRESSIFFVFDEEGAAICEQEYANGELAYFQILGKVDLPTARWVRATVAVDLRVTPRRATVTFDGKTVLDQAPLARPYEPTPPEVTLGVDFNVEGPAYDIDYDDVRVDLIPP